MPAARRRHSHGNWRLDFRTRRGRPGFNCRPDAALALRRGEAARAIERLDAVAPYDHAPSSEFWPPYLRGLAYLQLKDGPAAGVQFEGILSHRGEAPTSPLYPLAHLGAARAAVLTGDIALAAGPTTVISL